MSEKLYVAKLVLGPNLAEAARELKAIREEALGWAGIEMQERLASMDRMLGNATAYVDRLPGALCDDEEQSKLVLDAAFGNRIQDLFSSWVDGQGRMAPGAGYAWFNAWWKKKGGNTASYEDAIVALVARAGELDAAELAASIAKDRRDEANAEMASLRKDLGARATNVQADEYLSTRCGELHAELRAEREVIRKLVGALTDAQRSQARIAEALDAAAALQRERA